MLPDFHDIGMIVENQVEPELFCRVSTEYVPEKGPLTDFEKTIIGTNHCEVGALLAKKWNLPDEIQHAVRYHHNSIKQFSPSSITGTIQLAEYFTGRFRYTALPGLKQTLCQELIGHIHDNIDEYRLLTKDLPIEFQKAKEIYNLDEEAPQ